MKDIYMFCDDPDCPCDDMCCQDCDKREQCGEKCSAVSFKERIYASDESLITALDEEGDRRDIWLLIVAAERIRDAAKEKKERDQLLAVLQEMTDAIDSVIYHTRDKSSMPTWCKLINRARKALGE